MDLQGSIERFELSDIFQLLSVSKKTGTLGVQRGEDVVMVYFRQGDIIFAHNPNRKLRLGDLLIRKKKLTISQLERAMRIQRDLKTRKKLGELLVLESFITRKDLEDVVRQQVEDVIYDLLRWETGNFKFYENKFPTQEDVTINISTENLILESVRRLDEMEQIQSKLPPFDTVLGLSLTETRRTKDIALEAEEWNVLTLVNNRRDIRKIIDESRLGKLETMRRLAGLLLAGLVEPVKPIEDGINTENLEEAIEKLTKILEKSK
ncbi:MAG: DUF4388 domain-containing protein [Candidatus Zixiibacteriota bacterium]